MNCCIVQYVQLQREMVSMKKLDHIIGVGLHFNLELPPATPRSRISHCFLAEMDAGSNVNDVFITFTQRLYLKYIDVQTAKLRVNLSPELETALRNIFKSSNPNTAMIMPLLQDAVIEVSFLLSGSYYRFRRTDVFQQLASSNGQHELKSKMQKEKRLRLQSASRKQSVSRSKQAAAHKQSNRYQNQQQNQLQNHLQNQQQNGKQNGKHNVKQKEKKKKRKKKKKKRRKSHNVSDELAEFVSVKIIRNKDGSSESSSFDDECDDNESVDELHEIEKVDRKIGNLFEEKESIIHIEDEDREERLGLKVVYSNEDDHLDNQDDERKEEENPVDPGQHYLSAADADNDDARSAGSNRSGGSNPPPNSMDFGAQHLSAQRGLPPPPPSPQITPPPPNSPDMIAYVHRQLTPPPKAMNGAPGFFPHRE